MISLSTKRTRFILFLFLGGIVAALPLLSSAQPPATDITIVNNSSREINHLYFSPPDQNNWGPDQLNSSVIAAGGGSVTLTGVACEGQSIKVIAEDHEGCFFYKVVACGEASTWTITNEATPDCGS